MSNNSEYPLRMQAFDFLCSRLQRNPNTSESDDTCSLWAASKAMVAFAKWYAAQEAEVQA